MYCRHIKQRQGCHKGGGGLGGLKPPQFLADQLTLSQPGGHILPTQYYEPSRIFRPCDGPDTYYSNLLRLYSHSQKNPSNSHVEVKI